MERLCSPISGTVSYQRSGKGFERIFSKTNKTCLGCLPRSPEKVLTCGHALCDVCVQYFGSRCSEARDAYCLDKCMLCGMNNERTFLLVLPPTAGIRILSLDGGGVRGIVPLVLMQKLESHLDGFQLPIRDFFDFVCGTSAGMQACCRRRYGANTVQAGS